MRDECRGSSDTSAVPQAGGTYRGRATSETRNISRKACPERHRRDAKHVLSNVEGAQSVVISTEGRNLSQIPRLRSG